MSKLIPKSPADDISPDRVALFIDTYVSPGEQCQNCGHDIVNVYVIQLAGGGFFNVGSECVKTLCGQQSIAYADKMARRLKLAGTQWRKQNPPPRRNETRESYLTRRIHEMDNARRLLRAINAGEFDKWKRTQRDPRAVFARYIEMISGVSEADQRALRSAPMTHGNMYQLDCTIGAEISRRRDQRFARRYGANMCDMANRISTIANL